jgi:hypothetical protein
LQLSARARAAKFAGVGQGRCQVRTAITVRAKPLATV